MGQSPRQVPFEMWRRSRGPVYLHAVPPAPWNCDTPGLLLSCSNVWRGKGTKATVPSLHPCPDWPPPTHLNWGTEFEPCDHAQLQGATWSVDAQMQVAAVTPRRVAVVGVRKIMLKVLPNLPLSL